MYTKRYILYMRGLMCINFVLHSARWLGHGRLPLEV